MNKRPTRTPILAAIAVLVLAVLACGPTVVTTPVPNTQAPQPTPNPSLSRADLIAATVQIFGANIVDGNIVPIYVGSGSIISRDGLILTNAHVASPASRGDPAGDPDLLIIGIVQSEDQPPVYAYRAEVRAVDGYMDLAVIQITATTKGDSVDPASLNLPYVRIGDSDQVHLGDHLNIFGFPVIGGNTITFTAGNVAGFSPEDQLGDRAWIKTDATISGGNSGGMATNDFGELIGVPTIAASGADTSIADCRLVQDTNGDGVLDANDTCIPIGGFINGLRPVNLARPLIQAARNQQAYSSPYGGGQQASATGSGSEQFGPITWAEVTGTNPCEPGDSVQSYASGALGLAAVFDFSGMTPGEAWAEIWSLDGKKIFDSVYTWDQGESGSYTDCLTNAGDPMPDGSYHVEYYAGPDGMPLIAASDVTVGSPQPPHPKPPAPQAGVQVSGTVTDQDSQNPIVGAYVLILVSGVSYDQWIQDNHPDNEIFTYAQTDSQGHYTLPDRLERNTPYTLVVFADGYQASYGDDLVWSDQDPSSYTLDVPLTQ